MKIVFRQILKMLYNIKGYHEHIYNMTNEVFTLFEGMVYAMLTSKSVQAEPRRGFVRGFADVSGRAYSAVVNACTLESDLLV